MCKKMLAVLLAFCLVGQNFVFANSHAQEKKSLKELRTQAKADLNALHQKYGQETKNLLPAVLAAGPMILVNADDLKALKEQLADALKKNSSLARQNERFLAERDQAMQSVNELLDEKMELATRAERLAEKNAEQSVTIRSLAEKDAQWAAKYSDLRRQVAIQEQRVATAEKAAAEMAELNRQLVRPDPLLEFRAALERAHTEQELADVIADALISDTNPMTEIMKVGGIGRKTADQINAFRTRYEQYCKSAKVPLGTINEEVINIAGREFSNGRVHKILTDVFSRLVKRAGRAGVGAVLLTATALVATSQQASAAEKAIANRILEHPELFVNASDDALAKMEKSKFASEAARQVAEVLHTASELSAEDMDAILQLYGQSDTQREKNLQQQDVKKAIQSALQTVKAY